MENKTAHDNFVEEYYKYMREEAERELENNSELISDFLLYCQNQGVSISNADVEYIQTIGIIANSPDLTNKLLKVDLDKDGLVCLNHLKESYGEPLVRTGYLKTGKFMFFPSHYFRRGYDKYANFSPRFCELFVAFKNDKVDAYIKLDNDRVRVNIDNSCYIELDTWYGAKFNRNINEVSDGLAKLRPTLELPNDIISGYFANVYCLDIKWSTKDNVKTFVAEEIKAESVFEVVDGVKYYQARYIHAEFDTANGCFRHFDGAMHLYTEEEYYQRRDSDMNFNSKSGKQIKSKSEKLFKMNGEISVEVWQEFVSHFFTGNPLVFEYFEGEYPEHIKAVIDSYQNKE